MSALTFTLKERPRQRIDVSALTPDRLLHAKPEQIARIELYSGNRKLKVSDLFEVAGEDPLDIAFASECDKLDRIGAAMSRGRVSVYGNSGAYLGLGMTGGAIFAHGDAGAFAASGMKAGQIKIDGNAGDFLAAALPGERRGMSGGTLLVAGDVGERAGDHMRRGMILIAGRAGDYCAARMGAGTIAVMGPVGAYPGYAMKRGTLLLFAVPERLPATFNDCGEHSFGFLTLLARAWRAFGSPWHELKQPINPVRRFVGDLANAGKGEILVCAGA